MATSPWYRSGTAKFTNGSTTVTGTGTEWVKFVRAGDGIQGPDGKLYQITNVSSNTSLSIFPAYGGDTSYWTIPIQGYVKQLADTAAQLVRDFEGGAVEATDAADRAKQSAIDAETQKNGATAEANRAAVEAGRSEAEADRSEQEADRAQQAADDAVAVVTGGDASIDPEAGKIPLAGASGTIKQAWVNDLEFELDRLRVATNKTLYGDGPYPALDLQFQGAKYLDPRIQFMRASLDWDLDGNEYGIDDPVLTDKGLWVSGARTNLFLWSSEFQGTYWTKTQSIVEPSTVLAPDGTTATKLIANTEESTHAITRFVSPPPGSVTFSVFVKAGELSKIQLHSYQSAGPSNPVVVYADLESGEVLQTGGTTERFTISPFPGGWWRISGSGPVIEGSASWSIRLVDDDGNVTFAGDGVSGLYIWGAQLEEGIHPTPYIPTEGSQVTVASVPRASVETLGSRTLFVDLEMIRSDPDSNTVYFFNWSTSEAFTVPSNGFLISARNSPTTITLTIYRSDAVVDRLDVPASWDSARKFAVTIPGNKVCISVDGEYAEMPIDEDMFQFARYVNLVPNTNRQSRLKWVKAISTYEKAMTEQQLRDLTS